MIYTQDELQHLWETRLRKHPKPQRLPRCARKKNLKRLMALLDERVNLGPVLVGKLKMKKALERGRKYGK